MRGGRSAGGFFDTLGSLLQLVVVVCLVGLGGARSRRRYLRGLALDARQLDLGLTLAAPIQYQRVADDLSELAVRGALDRGSELIGIHLRLARDLDLDQLMLLER